MTRAGLTDIEPPEPDEPIEPFLLRSRTGIVAFFMGTEEQVEAKLYERHRAYVATCLAKGETPDTVSNFSWIRTDRYAVLEHIITAEAASDFESARILREALKQLDAAAKTEILEADALDTPERVVGEDNIGTRVWIPGVCCPSMANANYGEQKTCLSNKKSVNGFREIAVVLDTYPQRCGICKKPLYMVRQKR
jgi:hypothetical protein